MPKLNIKRETTPTDFEKIKKNIASGQINPLYLLRGEDHRTIEKNLVELLRLIIPEDVRDGNYLVMGPKNFSVNEIIDFSNTMPFLAPYRVVLIENSLLFLSAKNNSNRVIAEQERFINWLQSQAQSLSTFVLLFTYLEDIDKDKLSIASPLYKCINKSGVIMDHPISENVYQFMNAVAYGNTRNGYVELDKLFREGVDASDLGYGLMSRLRYPLKKKLSESQNNASKAFKIYLNSLDVEDKLRPRYMDIISENPRYVLEKWILGFQDDIGNS